MRHAIFVLACAAASFQGARAQELSCEQSFPNKDQYSERLSCLEKRIEDLRGKAELYAEREEKSRNELRDLLTKQAQLEVYGPPKTVEPIAGGIYWTRSYWGHHGDAHQDFQCLPPIEAKPNMVAFGSQDLGEKNERGCQADEHCDSAGEWCVSKRRTPGCYVNKDWYDWYMRLAAALKLPINVDIVCAAK
jgi:hypothetical protein